MLMSVASPSCPVGSELGYKGFLVMRAVIIFVIFFSHIFVLTFAFVVDIFICFILRVICIVGLLLFFVVITAIIATSAVFIALSNMLRNSCKKVQVVPFSTNSPQERPVNITFLIGPFGFAHQLVL